VLKWGQMRLRPTARALRRVGLGGLLPLMIVVVAATGEERSRFELRGACYCRAAGQLSCVGDVTERECDQRCAEALCDDWFWLERRPCWNWGYGG